LASVLKRTLNGACSDVMQPGDAGDSTDSHSPGSLMAVELKARNNACSMNLLAQFVSDD